MCGKAFVSVPSKDRRRKHGAAFCSRACHYAGRSAGISKRVVATPYEISATESARNSLRGAMQYASHSALPIPEVEQQIAQALECAGVAFVHQCVFETERGGICVDFYFPGAKLVVEVDGPHHKRAVFKMRDADRDEWLMRSGIRVERVGTNDAVQRVLRIARSV